MRLSSRSVSLIRTIALSAVLLAVGLAVGYNLSVQSAPLPREPALLWDDYIIAVAALYEREGDLEAAKVRLSRLSTSDPAGSVAALAAIYVPDARYGEGSQRALRDLAVALTGRPVATPFAGESAVVLSATQPAATDPVSPLFRNQAFWVLLAGLSTASLGVFTLRDRRSRSIVEHPTPNRALAERASVSPAVEPSVRPRILKLPVAVPSRSSQPSGGQAKADSVNHAEADARVTIEFAYDGGPEPLEEMHTITDPLTGQVIAGCGLTNGPASEGPGGGYVGFLVWLHELNSREPQTVGILAEGAGEGCKAAVAEWADYARLDELVVAKRGVVRTFETRRLRAAVSIKEANQTRSGRAKHKAFRHLEISLDVAFKHTPLRAGTLNLQQNRNRTVVRDTH